MSSDAGLVLTNFYTAPFCAPTHAELMSGTNHHRAGEGLMQVSVTGMPGYEGHLNKQVLTIAERLRDSGYQTYMAGKWHLGKGDQQTPFARGFARSFALLDGSASHYDDQAGSLTGSVARYSEDGQRVESLPGGFYSTDFYTDKILQYLRERDIEDGPFSAYLAYTAPHWPIQAPDKDIARQEGRYAEGYDVIRERRFKAWSASGFAPAQSELPLPSGNYAPWRSLTEQE